MPSLPRRRVRRSAALLAAAPLVLVPVLAACADDDHERHDEAAHHDAHDQHHDRHDERRGAPDGGDAAGEDAAAISVTASSYSFDPGEISVAAGEDVAIVLTASDIEHDFVIDGVDVHVHADAGETAVGTLRIDEPGTYTAYCSVPGHRDAGMVATVTVG